MVEEECRGNADERRQQDERSGNDENKITRIEEIKDEKSDET